jgi:hypothetical protein
MLMTSGIGMGGEIRYKPGMPAGKKDVAFAGPPL